VLLRGVDAMDNAVVSQTETDEDILAVDVSDDALERAGSAEQQVATWAYCTHPWYHCPWPQ
jgi:hypothetical protein